MSQQAPPQYSADGQYWWNGTEWVSVAVPAPVAVAVAPVGVATPERRLQAEIQSYISRGYYLVSQTPGSAELVKAKKFSFIWAVLWFLVFGIGLIVYLLYYASKRDEHVSLYITPDGRISRR